MLRVVVCASIVLVACRGDEGAASDAGIDGYASVACHSATYVDPGYGSTWTATIPSGACTQPDGYTCTAETDEENCPCPGYDGPGSRNYGCRCSSGVWRCEDIGGRRGSCAPSSRCGLDAASDRAP